MDYGDIARHYNRSESEVADCVERARRSMTLRMKVVSVIERGVEHSLKITREGVGPLDTELGIFHHYSFRIEDNWTKYSVLVMADLTTDFYPIFRDPHNLLVRIDSGCETGQMFGDRSCECRAQLDECMRRIAEAGEGLIINIPRQDGRSMGLPFKLATLHIQRDLPIHTVEAFALMDPDGLRDIRTYAGAVGVLKFFNIPTNTRLRVISNNLKKLTVFRENQYDKVELDRIVIAPTEHTERHLLAKQRELGHLLNLREPDKEK